MRRQLAQLRRINHHGAYYNSEVILGKAGGHVGWTN